MPRPTFDIRPATTADLDDVNRVIEQAILTWGLPERVTRRALPSYRYDLHDLDLLDLVVAETPAGETVGAAAWGPAPAGAGPAGRNALLLHGLYVSPAYQRSGVGSRLLDAAEARARVRGCDGLLVKAQPQARPFFLAQGLERLPVENPDRDYPHRFWLSCG